jgi:uncharacterized membrane protein
MRRKELSAAIALLTLLVAALGWMLIPEGASIPVHWNVYGTADRYSGKLEALLLIPALAIGDLILTMFSASYNERGLGIATQLLLLALQVVLIVVGLGLLK